MRFHGLVDGWWYGYEVVDGVAHDDDVEGDWRELGHCLLSWDIPETHTENTLELIEKKT